MSELLLPASLASWPKHSEEWPASRAVSVIVCNILDLEVMIFRTAQED
jgi:hypothetical protein